MSGRTFFFFVFVVLLGSLYFYDLNYFDFIDEISTLGLMAILLTRTQGKIVSRFKPCLIFFLVMLFYVFYSVIIESNSLTAILLDTLSFCKPFVAFFAAYSFDLRFSAPQKAVLRNLALSLIAFMFCYWCLTPKTDDTIGGMLFSGSRLCNIAFLLALLFFVCSKLTKKVWILFFVFFSLGWLRDTSKFAALYCFAYILLPFWKIRGKKFLFLSIFGGIAALALSTYVVWDDIVFFLIEGTQRSFARPVMYETGWQILNDYVPFGSGLASFGTTTSGNFYSHIYYEYRISGVYGLEEGHTCFIADTFFPALAEFGYCGLLLFVWFFYWLFRKFRRIYLADNSKFPLYYAGSLLILFYLIESVADATFISNRGFYGMFFLGIMLSTMETSEEPILLMEEKEVRS